MSATTAKVKELTGGMQEKLSDRMERESGRSRAAPSSAEIRAAAKEGAREALREYGQSGDGTTRTGEKSAGTKEQSGGGMSKLRLLLLGLAAVYLVRRRRNKSSSKRM